jgi:hypothetical protein
MEDLSHFVSASSHHLKPSARDRAQFTSMIFQPRIDGWIAFDSAVKP